MPTYEFEIGANAGAMTNVETLLGIPPHPWEYHNGAIRYVAGSGYTYVDGYPQVIWRFAFLKTTAWATLIAWFGTAQAIARSIKTKCDDDTYITRDCILQRPVMGESATRGVGGWFDVELRFTHLEA